jgi:phage-related protein
MALRNMLVRVGADISGLSKGLQKAQKDVAFFGRNVTGSLKEIQGKVAGLTALLGGGMLLGSSVQDAMRYESLMATIGESLGASRKDFEKWASSTGRSLGFSRLQSAETASLMSLNFKKIATDQQDLTAKTLKMMEVMAVVSNKRGLTMQDTSDRIRSAMNGEADGADELGVNVRISAMKQSEAYKQMADGQPWDQLSDQMQSTIRYHHILNEVSNNLGLTMQDTTAQRMAVFRSALADVRLALGQAFLPILHVVLPILTTLANMLIRVLQIIGSFFKALFGGGFKFTAPVTAGDVKTTNQQAKALDGVGDSASKAGKKSAKAGKEAQKAWSGTFGFDEVHTIKDPEPDKGAGAGAGAGGGGGGGGGGVGGLGGLEMPAPDFNPFDQAMDALAEKFKKYTDPIKEMASKVWTAISEFAIEKFNMLSAWWTENGTQITQALKNAWDFILPIITFVVGFIWDSIKGLISGVITFFQGLIEFFTGVFTGDWQMVWEGIKKMFIGAFQAIWNFTNLTFIGGLKKGILTLAKDMTKNFKGFMDDAIKFFQNIWSNIGTILKNLWTDFKGIVTNIKNYWIEVCLRIALEWVGFANKVKSGALEAWNGIKSAFSGAVDWFARTIVNPIVNKFQEIRNAFKGGITQGIKAVLNSVRAPLNEMIGGLNSIKNSIPGVNMLPNIPRIPAFAKGGITSGPMLAMVGDNVGGREVIAPLDRLQSMLTSAVIQAQAMGTTNGSNTGDIILNIDGRTFARIINPHLAKETQRVGKNVRLKPI